MKDHKLTTKYKKDKYICEICMAKIWIQESGNIYMQTSESVSPAYTSIWGDVLSCDEMVIKNIIE